MRADTDQDKTVSVDISILTLHQTPFTVYTRSTCGSQRIHNALLEWGCKTMQLGKQVLDPLMCWRFVHGRFKKSANTIVRLNNNMLTVQGCF